MFCCSSIKRNHHQSQDIKNLAKITRFTQKEIIELKHR